MEADGVPLRLKRSGQTISNTAAWKEGQKDKLKKRGGAAGRDEKREKKKLVRRGALWGLPLGLSFHVCVRLNLLILSWPLFLVGCQQRFPL